MKLGGLACGYIEQEQRDVSKFVVDERTNASLADFPVQCAFRTSSFYQPSFHSHSGYEFYLCMQGNGSFIAGDRIHALRSGTFTVVKPMALHLSRPNNQVPFHRYIVSVQSSYLENLYTDDSGGDLIIRSWLPESDGDSVHAHLNARQLLGLQETLDQLEWEMTTKRQGYPLLVKSLLLQLFAKLERYRSDSAGDQLRNSEQNHLVENILGYMIEHYHESIRSEDLSRRFHVSRSSLCKLFKQTTGAAINEFLVAFRVNKAKELLQGTELPITEVALSVGFQDISHFGHTFKRLSGLAPSVYRSSYMFEKSSENRGLGDAVYTRES